MIFKVGDIVIGVNSSYWASEKPYDIISVINGRYCLKHEGGEDVLWHVEELKLYNPKILNWKEELNKSEGQK